MRYAKAVSVVAVFLCTGLHAAPQSARGMLYQSPFAEYKGMEATEDPSEHWPALNDLAAQPNGHVDYGTQIDEDAGRNGGVKSEPVPEAPPPPRAYMKQIVYRPDGHRHISAEGSHAD